MDDDPTGRPRNISRRDKRWSMNSQRLEEIVAQLMRPISDVRRNFDTDLSALLEEYLTEAGLHALDAEEDGEAGALVVPNFAELALLLQQSASIYSRKVDFLYQHVLSVSDSLHQSTLEIQEVSGAEAEQGAASAAGAAAEAGARRRRKASAPEGFAALVLAGSGAARRDATLRPPPTLPRMYVELEPRAPADGDAPLSDYAGEPVGLLADFHVAWRLQGGFLVEELRHAVHAPAALRALPLGELSAAIAAAAPPSPPPVRTPSPSPSCLALPPPAAASTPLPEDPKRDRKRRSEVRLEEDELAGPVALKLDSELRLRLRRVQEFSVPATWLRRVLRARRSAVLDLRRQLRAADDPRQELRGFDLGSHPLDVGGFLGWSSVERAAATRLAGARRPEDSDDDGFFEQSSLGDSDASRVDDGPRGGAAGAAGAAGGLPSWAEWRARVVERAAAGEARGRDVQGAAASLLAACAQLPPAPSFGTLLQHTAKEPADVAELFLATLFLANAGNVEIVQGAPLSLDSFSVRLLSDDQRLYRAALSQPADPHG